MGRDLCLPWRLKRQGFIVLLRVLGLLLTEGLGFRIPGVVFRGMALVAQTGDVGCTLPSIMWRNMR